MNEFWTKVLENLIGIIFTFILIVGIGSLVNHLFWKRRRKQTLFEDVYRRRLEVAEEVISLAMETIVCLNDLFLKFHMGMNERQKGILKDDGIIRMREAISNLTKLVNRQVNTIAKCDLYFSILTTNQAGKIYKIPKQIMEDPFSIKKGFNASNMLTDIEKLSDFAKRGTSTRKIEWAVRIKRCAFYKR